MDLFDYILVIEKGLTTIHAMTAVQPTTDSSSKKDWRGGHTTSGNFIPLPWALSRPWRK